MLPLIRACGDAVCAAMTPDDQQSVRDWVRSMGGAALFELELPRMRRQGVKTVRES